MAERETKTGVLEFTLGSLVRFDVIRREYAAATGGESVGEMDVYSCSRAGTQNSFFYKEVYGSDGRLKGAYIGASEGVIPGRETLDLMDIAGIKQGHVTLTNRREVKDG